MIDSLQVEILNTIKNYEKRVEVTNLRCIPDYDLNSVTVSLEYRIVGLPITGNYPVCITETFLMLPNNLTALDFEDIKSSIKTYLKN